MTRLIAVLLAAGLVAGCGSEKSDTGGGSEPAASSAPAESGGGKSMHVNIEDFTFGPKTVRVAAGGAVSFKNLDSANHNVVFDDKSVKGIDNLRQDESGEVTFDKAGTFGYVCSYHPGMEGTVEVVS